MKDTLLAGGPGGTEAVRALVDVALAAMDTGALRRGGPVPAGGPEAVAARCRAGGPLFAERGAGAVDALRALTALLAAGSVDAADPRCAAHLHCPPLAVAAAADLVVSVLNQSMDSWDQAPAASEFEREVAAEFAALCFPGAPTADALLTGGGTESNLLGLLLARERGAVRVLCGRNAHHSVARSAWQLGMADPIPVDCVGERLDPRALAAALAGPGGRAVVVATAGTTDTGSIDPLPAVAEVARRHGAWLHVDAAYGGPALFSPALRPLLAGVESADSVALDLHKLGWQPIASGVFVVARAESLRPLGLCAEYLNAADDVEAGMPDLLGRSLRTSRRADAFRIAVSLRALGRAGMAELVDRCHATAVEVAALLRAHPALRVWAPPELSTVVVRPRAADLLAREAGDAAGDELVAGVRRRLLVEGHAVVGRARIADRDGVVRLWLKLTLLNPAACGADYAALADEIALVAETAYRTAQAAPVVPATPVASAAAVETAAR